MADSRRHKVEISLRGNASTEFVEKDEFLIGRGDEADLRLADEAISRKHLAVKIQGADIIVTDLGSANGTYVKKNKIAPKQAFPIESGEEVILGSYAAILKFIPARGDENTQLLSTSPQALREHAESLLQHAQAEAKRLAEDNADLRAQTERLARNHKQAEADLERQRRESSNVEAEIKIKREARAAVTQEIEALRAAKRALEGERESALDALRRTQAELAEQRAQQETLHDDLRAAKAEADRAEARTREAEARTLALIEEAEQAVRRADLARDEAQALDQTLAETRARENEARADLAETQKRLTQNREAQSAAEQEAAAHQRRLQAEMEALTAEQNVKQLRLKVDIEELSVKKATLEKDAHQAHSAQAKAEDEARLAHQRRQESERAAAAAAEARNRAEHDLQALRAQESTQQEALRKTEREIENARARAEQEIQRLLEQGRLDAIEKAKQTDRELGNLRLREMKSFEQAKSEHETKWKEFKGQQLEHVIQAVSRLIEARLGSAQGNPGAGAAESLAGEVRDAVHKALSQENQASRQFHNIVPADPEAAQKAKSFWGKLAFRGGLAAGALGLLIAFPEIPGQVARKYMASRRPASDAFVEQLEEARRNKPVFKPLQDRNYKGSYTQNVIYTEGYIALKTEAAARSAWTLTVNRFLSGRLNNGDQVLADLIAAESVMVKELIRLREGITPENEAQGIARLDDYEAEAVKKMKSLLGSEATYVQFRELEKSFYLKSGPGPSP